MDRAAFFIASMSVVAMPLVEAARADACDTLVDRNLDVAGDARAVSQLVAPRGGLWVFELAPGTPVPPRILLRDVDTGDAMALDEAAQEFRGPTSIGLRVPRDAAVGARFAFVDLPGAPSLMVADAPLVDDEASAPRVDGLDATPVALTVVADPCVLGFMPLEERHHTTIVVDAGPADRAADGRMLVDAWVLGIDEELPDEDAPRALDAFLALSPGGAVAFDVERVGSFVVHVRLRDAETGLTSNTGSVEIINAPATPAGYDLPGGWHWGCAAVAPSTHAVIGVLGAVLFGWRRRRPA